MQYRIDATKREVETLWALAAMYTSADVLHDALIPGDDAEDADRDEPVAWYLTEADAWTVIDAIESEDAGVIPCLDYDTHLGRSLLRLQQIVV